jgi:serine protease Do
MAKLGIRKILERAVTTIVVVLLAGAVSRADVAAYDMPSIVARVMPTVVNISVRKLEQPNQAPSVAVTADASVPLEPDSPLIKHYVASGFVIDPAGVIVTNYHAVENAFEIAVTLEDGSTRPGSVFNASRVADLALVKVSTDKLLPASHWGNSDALHVGDQVFAVGNPFGLGMTVTSGIVSALNRDIQNSPYDELIQTDAAINHGNSGGPLFDMKGEVVGVNSDLISPTAGSVGLGFALPASSARFVVDRLLSHDEIRPAWIGMKVQQVTLDLAQGMGLMYPQGSVVSWVIPGGPAQKAGLQIGDIILRLDGKPPSDERALLRDIAETHAGDTITLVISRGGQEQSLSIATKEWPRSQWDKEDAPLQVKKPDLVIPRDLGLSLSAIPVASRANMGLEDGMAGVLITNVLPNSDPSGRGLHSGDIILRVWDQPVDSPETVQSMIDAARAQNRNFVVMLVLPRQQTVPGPRWVALQLKLDYL